MKDTALERILHNQGFGSRRVCRALVRNGSVAVDGQAVDDPFLTFPAEGIELTVDGEPWVARENVYLALNKPPGFECSRKPTHHETVMSLLPAHFIERGVQPAGRLDQDTTGPLLLSDDGAFIHATTSPKHDLEKTYIALTAAPTSQEEVDALLSGVLLRGQEKASTAAACRAVGSRRLEIVITEGKYHQVKRMVAAAGNRCRALHRTALGALTLDELDLPPGEWCVLDEAQREAIFRKD